MNTFTLYHVFLRCVNTKMQEKAGDAAKNRIFFAFFAIFACFDDSVAFKNGKNEERILFCGMAYSRNENLQNGA